ncbi:MAG: hypothetical protein ACPLYF_05440 [Fervidobacterium sp.]
MELYISEMDTLQDKMDTLRGELKQLMKVGDVYSFEDIGRTIVKSEVHQTETDTAKLQEYGIYDQVLSTKVYVDVEKVKAIAQIKPELPLINTVEQVSVRKLRKK